MTSLLSQFSGIALAVAKNDEQKKIAESKKPGKQSYTDASNEARRKGGETRSARVQAKYAAVFATPNTVAKASAKLAISHVACLNQCYRYEARGLLKREEDRDPETGALLFTWVQKEPK